MAKSFLKKRSHKSLMSKSSCGLFFVQIMTGTKQPSNCHPALIQMLLNSDWCMNLCDITFSQMSLCGKTPKLFHLCHKVVFMWDPSANSSRLFEKNKLDFRAFRSCHSVTWLRVRCNITIELLS